MKYEDVKIQPLPGDKYLLLEDLTFENITVPNGYITNGADIPRIFWSIYPPNKSDFLPAVIIHDYMCDKEDYERADDLFEKCLVKLGVRSVDKAILVKSVRLYHRIKLKIKRGK